MNNPETKYRIDNKTSIIITQGNGTYYVDLDTFSGRSPLDSKKDLVEAKEFVVSYLFNLISQLQQVRQELIRELTKD